MAAKAKARPFKWGWRSLASYFLLFSSIVLFISGVILFISPSGRVARDSDWRLLALDKEQWGAVHTIVGFAGVIFATLHLVLNWRVLVNYLWDRVRHLYRFRIEFVTALLITILLAVGSAMYLPPFGTIMDFGEEIKRSWPLSDIAPQRFQNRGGRAITDGIDGNGDDGNDLGDVSEELQDGTLIQEASGRRRRGAADMDPEFLREDDLLLPMPAADAENGMHDISGDVWAWDGIFTQGFLSVRELEAADGELTKLLGTQRHLDDDWGFLAGRGDRGRGNRMGRGQRGHTGFISDE